MSASLPEPRGAQKDVVYLRDAGHTVVLGTAGSGKTTMAVLRARWLADEAPVAAGPTLLVTFNKALVTYLKQSFFAIGSRLKVETYHKFARRYLDSRGKMSNNCICGNADPYIARAIEVIKDAGHVAGVLDRPVKFFRDELHWIAGHGIANVDSYTKVRRIGRARPLQRHDRDVVFAVRNVYIHQRAQAGFRYDWDDLATAALEELKRDTSKRRYKHIIVDEGQDFTPQMIRSLAAAIPADGSLTFFGDYAQQMYGSRLSWRSLGLNVSKPVEFRQNYRNTRQIARLALAMSDMPHFKDDADLVVPVSPTADGPLPTVWKQSNEEKQLEAAAEVARDNAGSQSVAILMRKRQHEARLVELLQGRPSTRLHRKLNLWVTGPHLYYGTFHAAKGMEFDTVIIPYCDDSIMPDEEEVDALGMEAALAREARLLYVGVTRARSELVLLHSDKLTKILPTGPTDLYQSVS